MCIFRLELLFSVKRGRPGIHLSSVPPLVVSMSRLNGRDHCLRFLSRPSRACLHPSFYNWLYTYTLMLVCFTLCHSQHDITKTKKRTLPAQISSIRINTDRFTSNLLNSKTTDPYVTKTGQLTINVIAISSQSEKNCMSICMHFHQHVSDLRNWRRFWILEIAFDLPQ